MKRMTIYTLPDIQLYANFKRCLTQTHNETTSVLFFLMVFNATFNNISVISWPLVLMLEEIGGPGENHRSVASH
jgi:hypothetical protein